MASRLRTTDYGTVVLHVVLVGSVGVLVATGLRIASDDPESQWLAALDAVLPVENLWLDHLVAAIALTGALAAYSVYVRKARLRSRTALDRVRFVAMLRPGRSRWAAINVLVYWVLITCLWLETATGTLLFLGYGGAVLDLHRDATFLCLGAIVLHVALHAAYGGIGQLLRVLRPVPLTVAPPPPDFAELLAVHLAHTASQTATATSPAAAAATSSPAAGDKSRSTASPAVAAVAPVAVPPPIPLMPVADKHSIGTEATAPLRRAQARAKLMAHPLATALTVGVTVAGLMVGAERGTRQTLRVSELKNIAAPRLDGDLSDPAWAQAAPVSVLTTQGGDFGGSHESLVEVRAVHDGEFAYFAFVWDDPTRSLKHQPLVKRGGRWFVAATRDDLADEQRFNEDKFAVLLTRPMFPLIGAAIHLARRPLADRPGSSTNRGLHYTPNGGIADLWQWRASHEGPAGHIDNCHFGGPEPVEPGGTPGHAYAGGFAIDPGAHADQSNIVEATAGAQVQPRRLPKDGAAMSRIMGRIGAGPRQSESEGARWWMTESESVPYSRELDAAIPDETVVPSVVFRDTLPSARSDIRGVARWNAGRWTLELARRLYTGSPWDVPIKTGSLMWVAAFDHAEKRHTRHLRPFMLEVE